MPTPRPIDPYRPPRKPEGAGEPLASGKNLSGGKIALLFFFPLIKRPGRPARFTSPGNVPGARKSDGLSRLGFTILLARDGPFQLYLQFDGLQAEGQHASQHRRHHSVLRRESLEGTQVRGFHTPFPVVIPTAPPLATSQLFHLYLIAYGAFRFAHKYLRATPKVLGPLSGYQFFALTLILLGITGFYRRRKRSKRPYS